MPQSLLDRHGRPLRASLMQADDGRRLPRPAYQAAGFGQALAGFQPPRTSADSALLRSRELMSSRAHDLVRNDGWAKTGIDRWIDQIVGPGLKLKSKPDYRALGADAAWAREFGEAAECAWRLWANDTDHYADWNRQMSAAGLQRLLLRHMAIDNECFAILRWRDDEAAARSGFRTAVEIIDPDRISNPMGHPDREEMRGGIEFAVDEDAAGNRHVRGEPVAYHIRQSHPWDVYTLSGDRFRWVRVPRETDWGRRIVIHGFEPERAGQSRAASRFAPIMGKLRMLGSYDEAELKAAIVNSIFAAFIKSPFPDEDAFGALRSDAGLSPYVEGQLSFHAQNPFELAGTTIPHLYPGEELEFPRTSHPNTVYEQFERQALRGIAGTLGLSYEQLSSDWSQVNYSSARAALLEVWKGIATAKQRFEAYVMDQIWAAVLEEAFDRGLVPLFAGAPDFAQAKAAWCGRRWLSPPRGWVDPVKEAAGVQMRLDAMVATLEDEAAAQGYDYAELLDQRATELQMMRERGLPLPDWAAGVGAAAIAQAASPAAPSPDPEA